MVVSGGGIVLIVPRNQVCDGLTDTGQEGALMLQLSGCRTKIQTDRRPVSQSDIVKLGWADGNCSLSLSAVCLERCYNAQVSALLRLDSRLIFLSR